VGEVLRQIWCIFVKTSFMTTVENTPLVIPSELVKLTGLGEQELKIELAIYFYKKFNLSSGKAARFAGIPRVVFFHELGKRKIAVNYDEQDALHDVEAMKAFNEKHPISPAK
jgi:predicted HTH domain antitoxin